MNYTTYFAKVKNLPDGVVPIAICGRCPDGWKGLKYERLAPKIGFFMEWKKNHDNDYYVEHFNEEVLSRLDKEAVMADLVNMSGGRPFALVCYEKPSDFCHRHLVAKWLGGMEEF